MEQRAPVLLTEQLRKKSSNVGETLEQKKMNKTQKKYMFDTLSRLLNRNMMGKLFKVIFAYKSHNKNFFGFE